MDQPTNNPEADLADRKDDEEKKKLEAEKAKNLQVRKVSPIKKFFSSIRVKFLCIIIFFALLAAVAISLTASYMILYFYEDMDTLAMKERVQNAAIGLQRAGNTLTSRGTSTVYGMNTGALAPIVNYAMMHFGQVPGIEEGEEMMARFIYEDDGTANAREGLGTRSYSAPIQLVMIWDKDWNERLVFYQACDDEKGLDHCELIPTEKVFVDYEHGDYRMAQKDKVPSFFRNMKDVKPTACDMPDIDPNDMMAMMGAGPTCLGIAADIPLEEGGPMFYYFGDASSSGLMVQMMFEMMMHITIPNPLEGWHYAVGYSMRLLQQIQANRTGLCVSAYSSDETNLPGHVVEELKKKKDGGLVLDPHDYFPGTRDIRQNTDQVTLDQEYYAFTNKKVAKTDREYCDPSYDHSGDVSTSYAYLAYYGYDLSVANLSKDHIYLLRFDYHDPLTAELFPRVEIFILCLIILWFICIIGMIIFFNHVFLAPLDRMRKLRADFIKNILKGLDDDGALAQEVFGDMLDDTALIEANGDEISVMRTLQFRVDALYTRIIENRQSDLNRVRNHAQRDFNALKIMSFFLRRDDDNLRSILPGLLDTNEMARRFRRTNLSDPADKNDVGQELVNARHAFRSLKSILSNHIAAEFLKTFCTQRGRSSVNSFFFLMDVSWLNQVEGAARNESEDFLSSLFAESVPQSPSSVSPLSSPRPRTMDDNNGMNLSSDLLCALNQSMDEVPASAPEPDRPHHSHFAKAKAADADTTAAPAANDGRKKVPTLPLSSQTAQQNSSSSLGSPRSSTLGSPRMTQRNQFLSKNGETIAQFIHERYFGRKSLAQADMKHAALLGCSQIPDYLSLRDKSNISYSPFMYNNLVAAVTKKFSSDVIPQFMNSPTFQLMALCLTVSGFFEKSEKAENNARKYLLLIQQPEQEKVEETVVGVGFQNPLIHGVWSACKGAKDVVEPVDDESSSSSSSSDDDDDDDDDDDKGNAGDKDDDKEKKSEDDEDDSDSDDSDSDDE